MKIGAIFPTCEIGDDPAFIRDWTQAAEALGYSHIVCYDHVVGAEHRDRTPPLVGPYTEKDPFHEPFVVMAYMAALTTRIELASGVLILPQRQTVLVAKQAAELQLLSQGRFRMGVGTGWNHVEYDSLGEDFASRGPRLTEQVDLLRHLWDEEVVDYTGDYHRVERAGLLPRPPSKIPIWFGGFNDVAFRRAARVGDGFIFGSWPKRMEKMLIRVQTMLEEYGRSEEDFGAEALVDFTGDPESWTEAIAFWEKIGGTRIALRAMDTAAEFAGEKFHGYKGPKSYIDALETFMNEVGSLNSPG
jgi:probable F420-dependent oxidoreductase